MKTSKVYYTDDVLMSPQLSVLEGNRILIAETEMFPIYFENRRTAGLIAYPDVHEDQLVLPFCPNFWSAQFRSYAPIQTLDLYLSAATFVAATRTLMDRYEEKTRASIFDYAKWKLYAPEVDAQDFVLRPNEELRLDAAHGMIMGNVEIVMDDQHRPFFPVLRQKNVCSFALWTGQPAFLTYEHAFQVLESLTIDKQSLTDIKGKINSAPAEYTFISFNK